MRFLIAGGAGFLGSHLCDRLLNEGHSVVCLDNFLTGMPTNIAHIAENSKWAVIKHDVSRPIHFEGDLDGVVHLATPASPLAYQRHPVETLTSGSFATFNLLDLAKSKNARFFLTSTSEVYGDPEIHPQTEEYHGRVNPVGPRSMYDEAKRYSEAVTMAYHWTHGVDVKIVRIFNTYGPRMRPDDGRVIPTFISQALRGDALTLFGDGSQTRSFCYVDDLISGMLALLLSTEHGPINLGNPHEITMHDLALRVVAATASSSQLEFRPLPSEDPVRRQPDISKARALLAWEPQVDLDTGLRATVEWQRVAMGLST